MRLQEQPERLLEFQQIKRLLHCCLDSLDVDLPEPHKAPTSFSVSHDDFLMEVVDYVVLGAGP